MTYNQDEQGISSLTLGFVDDCATKWATVTPND